MFDHYDLITEIVSLDLPHWCAQLSQRLLQRVTEHIKAHGHDDSR